MNFYDRGSWLKKAFIFGLACACLSVSLQAQEELDIDYSSMDLEDLLNVEVTIASKSEETIADAPSSVSVFTRAEIQNMGITSVEELLNYVPGFVTQRQISWGSTITIQARGKNEGGYLSKEVLVMKDGVRKNGYFTGGSNMIHRMITIDDIKQVEVIRGPGSALYGSNAFLGVVNIVTVKDANEGTATFGSLNSRDLSANLSHTYGDWKVSAFARAYADEGEEYFIKQDFFGRQGITDDSKNGQDITLNLQYKGLEINLGHMTRDEEDFMSGIAIGGDDQNRNLEKESSIGVSYGWDVNDKFHVDLSTSFVAQEEIMRWVWPEVLGPDKSFVFGLFIDQENTAYNVDMNYTFSDTNNLSFGASAEERSINDNAVIGRVDSVITYFRGDAGTTVNEKQTVYAGYIQDQWRPNDQFKVVLGGRFDDYSDFGNTFNPRGAVIYSPNESTKLKGMYGQAFRAPSNSEKFQRNTLAAEGRADLEPEEITTLEFAVVQSYKKFQGTLTYFSNDIKNVITTIPKPGTETQTIYINQGKDKSEGLEFEFQASLAKGLVVRGAYTNLMKTDDEWSPDSYGSLILNYSQKAWNVNLNGIFRNKIDKVPDQGNVMVANFSARYALMPKFTLEFTVLNLNDEEYVSPDAPFTDTGIEVPNRGRQYYGGFNFSF